MNWYRKCSTWRSYGQGLGMVTHDNFAEIPPGARVTAPASESRVFPRLTVIVPVYNGEMHIARCLEGLFLSEYSSFEVIVVDDCSTDDTELIVERYPVRRVRTPRTLGPAGARNMGIGYAEASIVVFVDADVVLPPNGLGIIAKEFEQDSQMAALFGTYDEEPAWDDFCSQYKNLMHGYVHQKSNVRATTFWAGCGAVRKEIFIQVGGFDFNRYRKPSIEDIELGYRLVRCGKHIQLNKQLQVKHLKKWTLRNMIQTDIFSRAIPWTKLILETRNLPRDLNLTSGARLSTGLVGVLSMGWVILFLQTAGILPSLTVPHTFLAELMVVACIVAALVALNWDVYSYFAKKRGWWFAARVVPLHWLYYLYSGGVFVVYGSAQTLRLLVLSMLPAGRSSRATFRKSRSR
jgi:glycosyltransferase involved in cell wall biosynthesis